MVADGKNGIHPDDEEQELEELFASYVDKLNRGDELNPQEILAKYPLLGEQLLACLEDFVGADTGSIDMQLRTLGDYTLRRQIGRGGMGIVYDAWQNSLDRQVALKVLPVGIAADDRTFRRFMREAQTAARLNHENVVRVYGMGVESNTPYFAMEYVDGKTLGQLLAKRETDTDEVIDTPFGRTKGGLVDYPRIATAFADMADGLHHAHSKGVIHRDIKPSNLILDGAGRLRILDFGLARLEGQAGLTLTHDVLGTPLYMSPEQARRRKIPIDHRTDIYSLGATLYEMLTRRPPFRGKDNLETLSQIIATDPSPLRRFDPTIPKSLETIVLKCLRKNPKDRYNTAEAVAEDLRRFARGEPVEAQPLPPWAGVTRRAWKYTPRIGVIVMAATLVFLMVSLLLPTKGMVTRQVLAPALGGMGTVSPDGRYLSTVNWTEGNLAVHDFKTGEDRDLTDEGTWKKPNQFCDVSIWSPDSRQIAYYWINRATGSHLRIVGLDGSEPRTIASSDSKLGPGVPPAPWPRAWSQDGKYILAYRGRKDETLEQGYEGQIVLVSVADGSLRVLKSLRERHSANMSLSPDGRYVVFELDAADGSKKRDIYLLATDGSSEVPLVVHPADDKAPFWTPDGKRIVFLSDRSGSMGLWMLDVDDGKPKGTPTLVKEVGQKFRPKGLTQDGSLYYGVAKPYSDVYVAALDFDTAQVLTSPSKVSLRFEGKNHAPAWSPDGTYLSYATRRGENTFDLVIRSIETGQERNLTPKPLNMGAANAHGVPQWSPDGRSILVTGNGKGGRGFYLVDVQTGDFTTIVQDEQATEESYYGRRWPVFSADGTQIYYVREDASERAIMAISLETRRERELYRAGNWIARLALSPDGQRLAFFESTQDGQPAVLKTIPASGGEPTDLFTLQKGHLLFWGVGISWTPDGRYVVVGGRPEAGDDTDELWGIPATGGEPHKINLGIKVRQMSLHPDGSRIALSSREPGGGGEIWVMENFLP